MAEWFDAAVMGGGPAGATVALCLARRSRRVALVELSRDTPRYGETLPPEVNPALRELGIFEAFRQTGPIESPGIVSVWGGPEPYEQDFLRNPHGPGWHVDRARFDEMLCRQAAAAGAVRVRGGPVEIERSDSGWRAGEISARVVVDATGRNGLRIDGPCLRDIDDSLLAIVFRAVPAANAAPDLRTFIEAAPAGWWYSAPAPGGGIVAMLFTDAAVYRDEGIVPEDQLTEAALTRSRLANAELCDPRVVYVTSSCRRRIAGEGWLAAGDSASCYDPLSGRGIFKALRQGGRAAEAVDACLNGDPGALDRYAARVRAEFEGYVPRRRLYYASETRWSSAAFWRGRHTAAQRIP